MDKTDKPTVLPEAITTELLLAMPGLEVSPARRQLLRGQLLGKIAAAGGGDGPLVVRAGAGKWINFAPNVDMKILHDDGRTRTWLARFGPGGAIPSHIQTGDEEAYVLEGWCLLDEVKIGAGDYHRIGVGQRHGNIVSPEGCLIFVRSDSGNRHANELVAAR